MNITGIKLRNNFQTYYVDTNNLFIKMNTLCLAETEHGIDIGRITKCTFQPKQRHFEIKGKLIRKTTDEDLKKLPQIESIEEKAFNVCKENAKEKNLDLKLVSVKCLFDKTKIIFYFISENRIDFRELVRYLASIFRTRIEMRQIGVRDESRIIGGYGPCGRQLCCVNLKEEFEPVSIKMAKEQNINLNSLKISGMCGRLLCCLGYEYEVYQKLNKILPNPGTKISVGKKTFTVVSVEPLKQISKIRCGDHIIEISSKDMINKGGKFTISEEALSNISKSYDHESDKDTGG